MKKSIKLIKVFILVVLSFVLVACEKEIISELTINYNEEMTIGEEIQIEVISSVENDIIAFENMSPDIIELNDNKVKALEEGIAEIVITSSYKTSETISILVKESPAPTNISISLSGENFITEVPYKLEIDVLPSNASKEFTFNYTRSSMSINEETLEVTFLRAGTHSITCFSKKDRKVSGSITVEVNFNPEVEVYELLFVGNSLTKYQHDIPAMVAEMMREKGLKVNYTLDGPSAQWIIDHKSTFDKYITNYKYTHVILQEKSDGSVTDYNKFESAVLDFAKKIEENGAKIVLYQTWAYKSGLWNMSKQEMHEAIKAAYHDVANKVSATIVPSGDAFSEFEKMYGTTPTLYYDENHPSEYGAFLSACVHYATLTGNKASELEYVYPNIDASFADEIKLIADKVVFGE